MKDKISESSTAENLSLFRKKREYSSENSQIFIKSCGVYKIGMDPKSR